MPATSPFDILAEEIGAVAGRVERESSLRLAAAIADLQRLDAERELRLSRLEQAVTDRLSTVKDGAEGSRGEHGLPGAPGEPGERGLQGEPGKGGPQGEKGLDGLPGTSGEQGKDGVDGVAGRDGADGRDGLDGKDGLPGHDGENGNVGDPGLDGKDGAPGADGKDGLPGPQGESGKDGAAGRDGVDGKDGARGFNGQDGINGKDGTQGERGPEGASGKFAAPKAFKEGAVHYESDLVFFEGATWCARCDTAQKPPHQDWAPVALKGADAPVGEVCGLYDADVTYRQFDVVAFNGSEWRAKRDAPGTLPGDGWALSAKQGKRGDKGDRGDRGESGKEGKQGPAGPSVIERRLEGYTLIDTLSDGSTIACDIRAAFEEYHSETRG